MPKKFKGENSKAVEAKAKKQAANEEAELKKRIAAEDAEWEDDDKHANKKAARKEERDRKRQEQLERKQTNKELLTEETANLKGKIAPATKLTRAEIDIALEAQATRPKRVSEESEPEANLNRLQIEGEARNVDEAVKLLTDKVDVEKHPERRVKAAYADFEKRQLAILKIDKLTQEENPNLRMSQLKQMIKKEWMKSPENPLNSQNVVAYNTKV